ncbi:hypothetical protein LX36DRAFT_201923 [Colletotrichum falcatum]|nr:hypothetical protein LX36DRAFT_201923 [Colletotrichum falcatum]
MNGAGCCGTSRYSFGLTSRRLDNMATKPGEAQSAMDRSMMDSQLDVLAELEEKPPRLRRSYLLKEEMALGTPARSFLGYHCASTAVELAHSLVSPPCTPSIRGLHYFRSVAQYEAANACCSIFSLCFSTSHAIILFRLPHIWRSRYHAFISFPGFARSQSSSHKSQYRTSTMHSIFVKRPPLVKVPPPFGAAPVYLCLASFVLLCRWVQTTSLEM